MASLPEEMASLPEEMASERREREFASKRHEEAIYEERRIGDGERVKGVAACGHQKSRESPG